MKILIISLVLLTSVSSFAVGREVLRSVNVLCPQPYGTVSRGEIVANIGGTNIDGLVIFNNLALKVKCGTQWASRSYPFTITADGLQKVCMSLMDDSKASPSDLTLAENTQDFVADIDIKTGSAFLKQADDNKTVKHLVCSTN